LQLKFKSNLYLSWQRAHVHRIRVFRDGQWFDRFERARHSLLQRGGIGAGPLQWNLYARFFLEDIRVGDIVEYSYTIEGALPFFFHSSGQ